MNSINDVSSEPTSNDIVFDCEHCGKSLVIDVRGAGLKIKCPECNGDVTVPIPEGIELSDIDYSLSASPVEMGSESPAGDEVIPDYDNSDVRINELLNELEELRLRTQFLEKQGEKYKKAALETNKQVDIIRVALKEIDGAFSGLVEKSPSDTQELA